MTGEIEHFEEFNTIMNNTLDQLIAPLLGVLPDIQIKYMAVGTSTASIYTTQSQLGAEFFRTPVAAQTKSGTGQAKTYFYILPLEATQSIIQEVGIFGGYAASMITNSGTLISRILWNYDKSAGDKEVQVERVDTIRKI
jgi:hypothetical protein